MDHSTTLETWNCLLKKLENFDPKESAKLISDFDKLFEHLAPQTAIRLQKDYDSCTIKSDQCLEELLDKLDLSDKSLLANFLKMLKSFGYFRISQITYHTENNRNELEPDTVYMPLILKVKWYDMSPLLPKAGTLGWKGLMNHCLVEEERELMKICLQLLTQKLHFYSLILNLERFHESSAVIQRNGQKVAEKLFELIRDASFDDESLIGLDATLFNLMLPFTNTEQHTALIDAIVHDLFKPHMLQKSVKGPDIMQLYQLIRDCIMNKTNFQDIFVEKLVEHLKFNIVRRKRRHSVEVDQDGGKFSLESLIVMTSQGENLKALSEKVEDLELSSKSLQSSYILYWAQTLDQLIPFRILTAKSTKTIISTCITLLMTTSSIIGQDIIQQLTLLMTKSLDNTGQRGKLFSKLCDIQFLIELTEVLLQRTNLLSSLDTPVVTFYRVYLNRYLSSFVGKNSVDIEKITPFIIYISNITTCKEASRLIQYTFIHELAIILNSKTKCSNKCSEILMSNARTCSISMYKYIKRSAVESSVGVETLVSILTIGLLKKDQEILDSYSDPIMKLFKTMVDRVEKLLQLVTTADSIDDHPIDAHLPNLASLYTNYSEVIKVYLDYELADKLFSLLPQKNDIIQSNGTCETWKERKKSVYNEIKTRLDDIEERAQSADVFNTIINKLSVCPVGDIKKEKSCLRNYSRQMSLLSEVFSTLVESDSTIYNKILENTLYYIENCDPLDHPRLLFHFLMLEILIRKPSTEFFQGLSTLSSSLIRISKMVELGPSIHVFTHAGSHKTNKSIQCCTYSNCIKIYTLIFQHLPSKFTSDYITDSMQICTNANLLQYSQYSTRFHRFFVQLASAIIGLLLSICIGKKEESLKSSIPVFLSVFSNFVRCLIGASDRQKIDNLHDLQSNGTSEVLNDDGYSSKSYEVQLELLALDVGRVLNNLSLSRVKMIEYAPHLISTYIKDIQRASCAEQVRLHLNEGIFRIFNLIDAHQKERQEEIIEAGIQRKTYAAKASGSLFDMIHARLDQASREIFHDMHENYNRFFRYLGKC